MTQNSRKAKFKEKYTASKDEKMDSNNHINKFIYKNFFNS